MKNNSLIIILFFSLLLQVNSQTIPNGDFENWTNFGGWYDNPDFWTTNNSQIMAAAVNKYSNAYHGNFAAQVISGGMSGWCHTQFATSVHPSNLTGWVMTNISGTDTVMIRVELKYNGNAVDNGIWKYGSSLSSYTFINIPISQNVNVVDSVVIHIQSGQNSGTYVIVDYLQFEVTSGINSQYADAGCSIYPNPMTDIAYVKFQSGKNENYHLIISDTYGRIVRITSDIHTSGFMIERGKLAKGLYSLTIDNGIEVLANTKLMIP